MNCKKAVRIISVALNALLLCAGCVVLIAFLRTSDVPPENGTLGIGIFSSVTFLLTLLLLIIEFVSMLRISTSTFHTVFVALFLLLYAAFTPDISVFYDIIGRPLSITARDIAAEVCFIGFVISLLAFFRYTYKTSGKQLPVYPLFVAAAISLAAYIPLVGHGAKVYAHLLFMFVTIVYFVIMQVRAFVGNVDNAIFVHSSALLFSVMGMHTANVLVLSGVAASNVGMSTAYLWVCIFCFASIYMTFFIHIDRAASRAESYHMQNERLKMKVLIGQIKPHFIFNALTTIKSRYHGNVSEGDGALELFSDYMRESLSLLDKEIIPFEQELQNISRYIEFVNTSREQPFDIVYDIDFTDFHIPAFSLQPFIENAVKYSKVNEKSDGRIMISTTADDEFAQVRISDNGVGFDVSRLKKGAHGINNAKERLKLLINAEPTIKSDTSGTEITIKIRLRGEDGIN